MRTLAFVVVVSLTLGGCAAPVAPAPPTPLPTPTPIHAEAVAALQTGPAATQVAVAAATSIAASTVFITDASFDPSNVYQSAVTIANYGTSAVDLGGWRLLISNYRVTLPKTEYMTLVPGHPMTVHLTSSPTPTSGQNVYVGMEAIDSTPRVNESDIVLLNADGDVASTYPIH